MATQTNSDPRFAEYKPGTCKSCGRPLQFAFEVENGNLCNMCGPGSAKHQQEENQKHDQNFIEQSQRYTDLRNRHDAMAASLRTAIDSGFDKQSVADLQSHVDQHAADIGAQTTNDQSKLDTNAQATEARMRETVNANDSRETGAPEEVAGGEAGNFQTKDV